jgi:hypothetical protein
MKILRELFRDKAGYSPYYRRIDAILPDYVAVIIKLR